MNNKPGTLPGVKRVFIGIPVDKNSQRQINLFLRPIEDSRQAVGWVPAGNWHLTLAFLGNQPACVVENLMQLFDQAYQRERHFHYNMSSLTRFPKPEGKIIALVGDPVRRLTDLFQITQALLQRNHLEFCRNEFLPHITLGRIKRAKQVRTDFEQHTNINLNINKIALYQSKLADSGPVYSILKQTRLK